MRGSLGLGSRRYRGRGDRAGIGRGAAGLGLVLDRVFGSWARSDRCAPQPGAPISSSNDVTISPATRFDSFRGAGIRP